TADRYLVLKGRNSVHRRTFSDSSTREPSPWTTGRKIRNNPTMALGPFYVAEKLTQSGGIRGVALLMRHGETPWNREGRVMGKSPIELDEAGRRQVESAIPLARELAPNLIVSSPLARARQSADIIGRGVGIHEIIEDPRLSEVEYGRWEGMIYD